MGKKKKNEFRPDRPYSNWLDKLYPTQTQRRQLLKWLLYTLVLLVLSLLQDVVLSQVRLFGAATDLVPCGIFLICLLEGSHSGSVFALVASCMYVFSGSAPGTYCIVFITALAVGVTMFRQAFLQKGLFVAVLCCGVAMLVYELLLFALGLLLHLTLWSRLAGFITTGVLSIILVPVAYPMCLAISAIGGQSWKE